MPAVRQTIHSSYRPKLWSQLWLRVWVVRLKTGAESETMFGPLPDGAWSEIAKASGARGVRVRPLEHGADVWTPEAVAAKDMGAKIKKSLLYRLVEKKQARADERRE